jgi:hypothetical protein
MSAASRIGDLPQLRDSRMIALLEVLVALVRGGIVEATLHVLPVRRHRPLW